MNEGNTDILEMIRTYRKASASMRRMQGDRGPFTGAYPNEGLRAIAENRVRHARDRHGSVMFAIEKRLRELGADDLAALLEQEHRTRRDTARRDTARPERQAELRRIAKAIKLAVTGVKLIAIETMED